MLQTFILTELQKKKKKEIRKTECKKKLKKI